MKPEYTLVKNLRGTYELRVGMFVVALFFEDGTFTRIPHVSENTGVKVDEEGKIIEDHIVSALDYKVSAFDNGFVSNNETLLRRMWRKLGM